ncbi:MAG: hypothetical protein NTW57_08415 [Methylophilales bacterium]|nr:hypothetical protein [Methylophilales bacterium]
MASIPRTPRSGGPKTAAGKAVTSANSLKAGIYSNVVVLPGEDETEFNQLEAQFIQDFSPQDIAELTMVRELAVVVWKKHRLERLALSASLKVLNQPIEEGDYRRHGLKIRASAWYWINHLDALDEKTVDTQEAIEEEAMAYLDRELYAADLEEMKLSCPHLYKTIVVRAQNEGFFTEVPSNEALAALMVSTAELESIQFVQVAITSANNRAEDIGWAYGNADQIRAAVASVKAQRLLAVMELEMPRRVNDDLSRTFFRTLSELRKHQQWRQARNTLDVTPKTLTE